MSTMLIAQNQTRESGSFMGDQLSSLKTAYLFVENTPGVDKVIMSVSPGNEMHFLWTKFIERYSVKLVYDGWDPGNWADRHSAWDKWRAERKIEGRPFDHYRELYLRIHGAQRQNIICGSERGLGRRNIYEYWLAGQENKPDEFPGSDWFDDTLIHHPQPRPIYDVYISPHAKTQGNITFTFDFWSQVVHRLIDAGVTVTVGYNGYFCEELNGNPLYRKFWGSHEQWMQELCRHRLVSCGNTGTGWLASACGVPLLTMEPPNSQMPDHRYRECGLRNLVEVVDVPDPVYVAKRIIEEVQRVLVMTTGCYDVLHAGHVRHLERSRAMGTKLIVALNSDSSVSSLKGPQRPINPQNQRKAVLEALRCVDEVRVFDESDAKHLIQGLKPDVLTNGFGYTKDMVVGKDIVESYGGKVMITCTGDARDEPSTTKIVQRIRMSDVAEACKIGAQYSVNPVEKLRLVADQLLSVVELPGDVADLGAYRGGSTIVLRRLAPDKHLHVFDTWAGNPYDDELCHHKRGEWSASFDECQRIVGNGPLTHFLQGVFPHGTTFEGKLCFAYVDMDSYQSTRDAIEKLWPQLVTGGKFVLDDWNWPPCAGVEKAIREFFTEDQLQIVGNTCIVEKR